MADASATSFADQINNALSPISSFISSIIFYSVDVFGVSLPLVVVWLMAAGVILTLYLGFINLRGFRHAWGLVLKPKDQEGADGEISHFQALSAALVRHGRARQHCVGSAGDCSWRSWRCLLDDPCRVLRHVRKVRRMRPRREVSARAAGRPHHWRPDVLH